MTKYKIVKKGSLFYIKNTKTGSINKHSFKTLSKADEHIEKLKRWAKYNKTTAGEKRTAKHNKKVVALYHKTGLQPKDFYKIK